MIDVRCGSLNVFNAKNLLIIGSLVDESDPAFLGLLQSSGARKEGDGEEGGSDDEADNDVEGGSDAEERQTTGGPDEPQGEDIAHDADAEEMWITSVYEESSETSDGTNCLRVIATASVNVAAHRVQCAYFCGDMAEQQAMDHLDIIRVSPQ